MSLKEIGQRLRARREERGLTLRDAQIATKIRERYLQALEEGDEAALPGHVYTKGFLRAYANWLGLDGLALVEEYKAALGEDEPVVVAAEPDVERGPAEAAEGPRARRSLGREAAATPVRPRTGRPPATGPLELAAARRRRGNAIVVVLIVLLIAVLAGAYVLYLAAQAKLPEDEPSTAPGQEPVNGGAPVGRDPGTGPSDGATQPPGATGTPPPGNAAPGLGTEGGAGPGAGEDEGTATPTLRREPSGAGVTRYTVIASDIRAEVRVNA
ncbi:MAG TPA: helix-turn-helix domain-containing protein, partial [Bacillota bacterium]